MTVYQESVNHPCMYYVNLFFKYFLFKVASTLPFLATFFNEFSESLFELCIKYCRRDALVSKMKIEYLCINVILLQHR